MNPHRLVLIMFFVFSTGIPPMAAAAEAVKFEAVLYLFKSKAIPNIDFSKALHGRTARSGDGIVITPPATVVFDNEELVLGANYTWNGGQVVPARFYETKLPDIVAAVEQAATIRVVVPVQYLEKMPDGSLKVREVSGNSPDSPHYSLTLTARPATEAPQGYDLIVMCQMDVVTMQGREGIHGIDLEVGRPITARFDKRVEFWGRKGEWFGLMTGQKESGDYTLLLLLKVSPAGAASPAVIATKVQPPAPMNTDSTRIEASGYSVAAPDPSRWRHKKSDDGWVFENRINHYKFYRAGFSVVPAPAFPDRKSFLDFVKQAIKERSDTSTYESVKDDFQEAVRNGLWVVECDLVRDYWHSTPRGDISTDRYGPRVRILYAVDPDDSKRVIVVWYSWLGTSFDKTRFDAEASAFLGSLQKAPR